MKKNFRCIMVAILCATMFAACFGVTAFAYDIIDNGVFQRILPVNVAPAENGVIEVSCTEAACDSLVAVKLIPDEGYQAKGFTTGSYADWNIQAGEDGEFVFYMPWVGEEGITIEAEFEAIPEEEEEVYEPWQRVLPINVAPAENGTVIVNRTKALCDSIVTVTLIPDEGFKAEGFTTGSYADWNIQGGEDGVYTFAMPWVGDEGITIQAVFTAIEAPAEDPADPPAEDPVVPPAEDPVVPPAEDPVEPPAEDPVVPPAEDPVEDPAEEPVYEPWQRVLPVNVAPAEFGTVKVSCKKALCDSIVTVTLIPDEGYVAGGFTTGSYADWNIQGGENGVYTFAMPWVDDNGVTIQATFVPAE